MRFLAHLLGMIMVALAFGFGLSWYALEDGRLLGALRVGPWAAWPDVGAPSPNPYTRAYLSRTGALQLGLSEGVAFVAGHDSDGRPLARECHYRVEGNTPVATFWTLQALDPEGVSVAAPGGPIEMHSARIARVDQGTTVIHVSPALAPMNWLETTGRGPFSLVLTLYDTSIFSSVGEAVQTLPAITREAC